MTGARPATIRAAVVLLLAAPRFAAAAALVGAQSYAYAPPEDRKDGRWLEQESLALDDELRWLKEEDDWLDKERHAIEEARAPLADAQASYAAACGGRVSPSEYVACQSRYESVERWRARFNQRVDAYNGRLTAFQRRLAAYQERQQVWRTTARELVERRDPSLGEELIAELTALFAQMAEANEPAGGSGEETAAPTGPRRTGSYSAEAPDSALRASEEAPAAPTDAASANTGDWLCGSVDQPLAHWTCPRCGAAVPCNAAAVFAHSNETCPLRPGGSATTAVPETPGAPVDVRGPPPRESQYFYGLQTRKTGPGGGPAPRSALPSSGAVAAPPPLCDPDECLARCPTVPDTLGGRKVDPACVQGCLSKDCGGVVRTSGTAPRGSEYLQELQLRRAVPPSAPWTTADEARLQRELDEILDQLLDKYFLEPSLPQPAPQDPLEEMLIELVLEGMIEQSQIDQIARDWERELRRAQAAPAAEILKAGPGPSELLRREIESVSKDPKLATEIEAIRDRIRKEELAAFAAARARAVAHVRNETRQVEQDPAFQQILKGSVLSATRSLMEELNRIDHETQAELAREVQRLKRKTDGPQAAQRATVQTGEPVDLGAERPETAAPSFSVSGLGLGAVPLDPGAGPRLRLPTGTRGLRVVAVEPASAAASAGLLHDDVILGVDGQPSPDLPELQRRLAVAQQLGRARLRVSRAGTTLFLVLRFP